MGGRWRARALACCLLLGWLPGVASAASVDTPSLDAVLACMRGNLPKTVQVQDIQLNARERSGRERQFRARLYLGREVQNLRAMLRLEAPADLAGSAYLLLDRADRNPDLYVYVPALNRVRRINGAINDGKLWGTDLAYTDLRRLGSAVALAGARLLGAETIDARQSYRLAVQLPPDEAAPFDALRIWVDGESCLATRVDFLRGQRVRKRLSADAAQFRHEGPYWYATALTVADLDAGSQTRLKVLGTRLDATISDRLFSPAAFHLGR